MNTIRKITPSPTAVSLKKVKSEGHAARKPGQANVNQNG